MEDDAIPFRLQTFEHVQHSSKSRPVSVLAKVPLFFLYNSPSIPVFLTFSSDTPVELLPCPGIKLLSPAMEVWSPKYQTTRGCPFPFCV